MLSRMRHVLRLLAKAAKRNGATVFGSEFSPHNEKNKTSKPDVLTPRAPAKTQRSGLGGKVKKKSVRRMKKVLRLFSSPQDFF